MGLVYHKQGKDYVWGSLSSDLLDRIKGFLEEGDGDSKDAGQPIETLQLVNRH